MSRTTHRGGAAGGGPTPARRPAPTVGALLLGLLGPLAPPPAVGAHAAELRIGVAVPLSGPDAVYGAAIRQGAEMAAADGSPRVRIISRDDGNDPAKAVAVAKALVAEGVPAVIGDLSSVATVAASKVYAEAGVVDVAPVAAAPAVTERGLATVFRLAGRDDAEPASAVRLLLARHVGRVAIVHDGTSSGKGFADAVRSGLAKAGVADVFYGNLERGARDLAALAGRIKLSGAQVVVFGGGAADGGQLVRQLRDAGSRATLLGGSALASDEFSSAGGTAADGSMLVFPRDPRSRPAAADLLRRLRLKAAADRGGGDKPGADRAGGDKGGEPDAFVFYGYAAVQLIQQASALAGSTEAAAIARSLHADHAFQTVIGAISFDGKGDRAGSSADGDDAVYVWHKGATGRMAIDEQARF